MNKFRINHIQCTHNIRGVRYEKFHTCESRTRKTENKIIRRSRKIEQKANINRGENHFIIIAHDFVRSYEVTAVASSRRVIYCFDWWLNFRAETRRKESEAIVLTFFGVDGCWPDWRLLFAPKKSCWKLFILVAPMTKHWKSVVVGWRCARVHIIKAFFKIQFQFHGNHSQERRSCLCDFQERAGQAYLFLYLVHSSIILFA